MKNLQILGSMISASKGLVFSVIKASPQSILIELYEPLKEEMEGEPDFLERCIAETKDMVEKAMRDYAANI